ncbi:hypothetical protein JOB18_011283 [Solea senegalensis]|uniref:Uncharacterized protein n=1 Tax=Solea senegalensis TaxID=28829 RepID=A0AAV6S7J0_SOLSE|nr:hypothetical protein JOB18_011283 [Solea senegalensis]
MSTLAYFYSHTEVDTLKLIAKEIEKQQNTNLYWFFDRFFCCFLSISDDSIYDATAAENHGDSSVRLASIVFVQALITAQHHSGPDETHHEHHEA